MTPVFRQKIPGNAWETVEEGGGGGGDGLLSATVELSSADILALFDTPVELVAAAGAGTMISVLQFVGTYTQVTTPYTLGGSLYGGYLDSGNAFSALQNIGDALNEGLGAFSTIGVDSGTGMEAGFTEAEDKPILLKASNSNPVDGDGTLSMTTYYVVYSLP